MFPDAICFNLHRASNVDILSHLKYNNKVFLLPLFTNERFKKTILNTKMNSVCNQAL